MSQSAAGPQIAMKSKIQKMIPGIVVTLICISVVFLFLPSFWFWVGFEVVAALLVAIGCGGEWYLHHHPAGRKKVEKDKHHNFESWYIAAVSVGVFMELFALGHSIREGVVLEKDVAIAKSLTSSNEVKIAALTQENLSLQANVNATALELENANIKLAKIRSAIPPRQIDEKKRELFISTLLQTNSAGSPKIDIKVFVPDVDDPEAKNFAKIIRNMLNDAGYGTNGEDVIKIQPLNPVMGINERMPQVFALFATDNNGKEMPAGMWGGSIAPGFPTKMSVQVELTNSQIPTLSYYSSYPSDILGGVRNLLNYIGVPTGELKGATILKPYEVGFYIPTQAQ